MAEEHGTALIPGWFPEFAGAVVRQLPRDIDQGIANGWSENQAALKKVLREVLMPDDGSTAKFKVWKTIKLGLRKSPQEYRKALLAGKYQIGTYANQILDKIPVSNEEVEVDLARVSGRQLGFKVNTRRDVIYERALELGLQQCPAEVGPALREQYTDQPMREWVLIGMDPIAGSGGGLRVFVVGHDVRGQWLYGDDGDPDHVWDPGPQWVFVLPSK